MADLILTTFDWVPEVPRGEPVLAGREWLAGSVSVADILMSDVVRLVDRFDGLADYPACTAYVARATARRRSRRLSGSCRTHLSRTNGQSRKRTTCPLSP